MNKIEIIGNLVHDIEPYEKEQTGKTYARFTIASDRSRKEDSKTDFFPCVAYDSVAVKARGFKKGAFVRVRGSVHLGSWEGKNTIEVTVRKIELVNEKDETREL